MLDRATAIVPLLLRVPEVAIMLGASEREVWGMLRRGELAKVTVPGRRMTRVAREDVERLVQRWRAMSNDESQETL
jgi:predicted DNA-binding transcriptional regulator AlpA